MRRRGDPRVDGDVERALRFARERELDGYVQYMLGVRANLRLLRGAVARRPRPTRGRRSRMGEQLRRQPVPGAARDRAAAGAARRRRGRARRSTTAWEHAVATQELQRLAPAAAARAEHAWLDGDLDARGRGRAAGLRARASTAATPGRAPSSASGSGAPASRSPPDADDAAPYARSVAGDWRGAAAAWATLGFPYERAEALCEADDEDARLEALAVFDEFGAARAAAHLRRRLRAAGVRRIPRGPRAAPRAPGRPG